VENVDPDEVMRQPDEDEVIRPASPDTARRVGEEALAAARQEGRSKDIKKEDTVVIKTIVKTDGTEEEISETLQREDMPNKNTTESGQLVGGVSIGLGPPRSLISLKRHHFTCDVIIRDFHLLDYAFGGTTFEGPWLQRNDVTIDETKGTANFNVLDRFTMGKRVAANAIPLDIPSMCLDNKARFDLANMPWNKMKFVGGNIAVHAPRYKENQTINQTRLAYTDTSPAMNNVDQKNNVENV